MDETGTKQTKQSKPPKRLTKVAPVVFANLRRNPPEWLREFDAWVNATLGPRPVAITSRRAAEEWDCAVVGALLSWGYFDAMLRTGESDPAAEPADGAADDARPAVAAAESEAAPVDGAVVLGGEPADEEAEDLALSLQALVLFPVRDIR